MIFILKDLPVVQGIEFTELDKNISIYPNPTSGEFSIDFNDTWEGDVNCKITRYLWKVSTQIFLIISLLILLIELISRNLIAVYILSN